LRGNRKTPKKRLVSMKITAATTTYWMICLTPTKIRGRGSRNRTMIVETRPKDLTNKTAPVLAGTQQMGSKKEERKRRKSRSSRQMKKRTIPKSLVTSNSLNNHCRVLERVIKLTPQQVRGRLAETKLIKMAVKDSRGGRSQHSLTVLKNCQQWALSKMMFAYKF
jgi:hypothetical protein